MKFLFTCAGTAGHINPAIAIADKLRDIMPDAEFLFIGSGREMENRLIPMAGYRIENIKASGFSRGFGFSQIKSNLRSAVNIVVGTAQAKKIIRDFAPNAVIGTGGYVCFPVIKSAAKMKIPTFAHESNAIPGLAVKMIDGTADKIMVAFPGLENLYKHPERVEYTGTPIRGGFSGISQETAAATLGYDEKPIVVTFWGSLGASRLYEATAELIKLNETEKAFRHIIATGGGEAGYNEMCTLLRDRGIAPDRMLMTDMRRYIDDMPLVMTASSLVLCRSGASTLGELTAIGKPSILVPSPYVADNHQEKNARRIEKSGGAVVMTEKECTGKRLFGTITDIIRTPGKLEKMSDAVSTLGVPDSADRIAELILSLCAKQK